jgi:hypothetical protein
MNLPSLNKLYIHDPFASVIGTIHPHDYLAQTNLNQPYLKAPPSEENHFPPLTSISSKFPNLEGVPSSPTQTACVQCKGHKFNFTAYFHNTKIFAEPPHHLLPWVERSYLLKNRLQSLLVTYALQVVDPSHFQDIEVEINTWGLQVDSLAHEVAGCGGGSGRVVSTVTEVHQWTKAIMKQLWEHVQGTQVLPMPKGRVKELVFECRKGWERVWIACAEQRHPFS